MAQLITVAITDNEANILEKIDGNFVPIIDSAMKVGMQKLPWVTAIDEYGNTYINRTQAEYVIKELESLNVQPESKQCLEDIIEALKNIEPHTLIAFYGD